MAVRGADPDQLRSAARELLRCASTVERAVQVVGAGVESAPWHGPDNRAFRRRWRVERRQLRSGADQLRDAAAELDRHAGEQEAVSAPAEVGGTAAAAGAATPDPPRSPTDPLPLRTTRHTLEGSLGAGPELGGSTTHEVADLPGPMSRVSEIRSRRVGLGLGLGARSEVWAGEHSFGASAGIDGSVGLDSVSSRSWYVDDAEAASLVRGNILAGAAEDGLGVVVPALGVELPVVGSLAGGIVDLVRGVIDDGVSDAQVTTSLVGVGITATAAAALGSAAAAASVSGEASLAVGTRERPGGRSLVARAEGSAAAALPAVLGRPVPTSGDAAGITEVEVFPAGGGQRAVAVYSEADRGGSLQATSATIHLDERLAGDAIEELWSDLRRGDLRAAGRRSEVLRDAVIAVSVGTAHGSAESTSVGAQLSVSAELGLSVAAGWERTEVDWSRPVGARDAAGVGRLSGGRGARPSPP